MTATELKEQIVRHGFHPVPVLTPGEDSDRLPRFDGTLDEFWTAAQALSAKTVFFLVHQMDESDFERPASTDDIPYEGTQDDDDDDTIVLEDVMPSIAKYRKYVGKDCAFVLIAKGGYAEIDFLLTEPWWDEFHNEADKAVETWIEQQAEEAEAEEAENEKRNDAHLKQLRALIADQEFCRLRTQRAMMEYAIERIPQLDELSEFVLKPEIQTLRARIEARGLNRKK